MNESGLTAATAGWLATADGVLRAVLDVRVRHQLLPRDTDPEILALWEGKLRYAVSCRARGQEHACWISCDEDAPLEEVQRAAANALKVVLLSRQFAESQAETERVMEMRSLYVAAGEEP